MSEKSGLLFVKLSRSILPRSPLSGVLAIRGKIMKHLDNRRAHYEALLPCGVTSSNVCSVATSFIFRISCTYRVGSTRLCNNTEVISSRTAAPGFAFLSCFNEQIARFSFLKVHQNMGGCVGGLNFHSYKLMKVCSNETKYN